MNASSAVAMTSTIASPIATMSSLEEITGALATRTIDIGSTLVARHDGTVTHQGHDRQDALRPVFTAPAFDFLRRDGVHCWRSREQAGRTWPPCCRSGYFRLLATGGYLELGRRASRSRYSQSARPHGVHPARHVARSKRDRARLARLSADGSQSAVGVRDDDEGYPTDLAWWHLRLWRFDVPQRHDLQPPQGTRRRPSSLASGRNRKRS